MHRLPSVVYPPRAPGLFCVSCFEQAAALERFSVTSLVHTTFALPHDLHRVVNQVGASRALCTLCRRRLLHQGEAALRELMATRLLASPIDATSRCSAYLESEVGISVASWCFGFSAIGALSPGLRAWAELLVKYPRDPLQPSIAERAFGGGTYAALSAFNGGLWIDNLVSRRPGQGFGRAALRAICIAADAAGAAITGAVQANDANGQVRAGLSNAELLRWYTAEGFERLPVVGALVVCRRPLA